MRLFKQGVNELLPAEREDFCEIKQDEREYENEDDGVIVVDEHGGFFAAAYFRGFKLKRLVHRG